MKRRDFITLLGGSTLAWPLAARGQEPGRTYRVGALNLAQWDRSDHVALREELRRLGFVEGQNLTIDRSGYGLRGEQFAEHAAELVKARVDVIICAGIDAIRAAQKATATVPILGLADDMVASGFVRSLAKPGGNTTGVSILSTELDNKRQALLLELIPHARRIAALVDSGTPLARQLEMLQEATRAKGVELVLHPVARPEEIRPAIDAAKATGAEGLNVLATPLFAAHFAIIRERTAALGLPAMYHLPDLAKGGGLIAYGPSIVQIYSSQIARLLVKLLRGTVPSDIPVEQPTKFELVINLKTAKELALAIPPVMLAQADEVIE